MTEEPKKQHNREYKDRLFKLIFRKKEDLLELYNAINGTDYHNPEDVEVNTIEDVVYMGMKNDLSFLIADVLNLYEHQSTFSPNLPLRGFLYFADLYRKIVADSDIYSSKLLKLPFPQFVVFYNGTKEEPERQVLHLRESFPKGMNEKEAAIDCHAVVLNINIGNNAEIMEKCKKLQEYAVFINRIREYIRERMTIEEAIDCAVEECIREGILKDILQSNRAEVVSMLLTEYDEQAHLDNERRISREEGEKRGEERGRKLGEKRGRKLGEERINELNRKLIELGRTEDVINAAMDKDFQKELFQEFGI